MSYDEALRQMRQIEVAPPSFTAIEQGRRWRAEAPRAPAHGRVAMLSTCAAMFGHLVLTIRPIVDSFTDDRIYGLAWWQTSLATLLPAALLLWAVRLMRRPGVGPQMLLRAVLWSNLVVGALIAGNFLTGIDRAIGAAIAIACAVAIVRLGSRGLEDDAPSDVFRPVRFRGHLLLALVMAFADAQTLLFAAVMQLRVGMTGWNLVGTLEYAGPITVAAATMTLVVWGLYRLRTWALFLNLAANVAIAYFALEGALNVSTPVAAALAATAAVQMFLPVPILAVALGDREAGQPLLRTHADALLRASVIAIAGIAVVATVAAMFEQPSGWLTGSGQAFERGIKPSQVDPPQPRGLGT
jgi:hypothetical protein